MTEDAVAMFSQRRTELVNRLRASGALASDRIAEAMAAVPRERFLPAFVPLEDVYADQVVTLATGADGFPISTASQPTVVATMLEQLDVRIGQRVLEVGTASGYNAALLATLVGHGGRVTSIEIDEGLAQTAQQKLADAGAAVTVACGDGWQGAPSEAPYDRIVVTTGVWDLAPSWLSQLRDHGLLVVPLWLRPGVELSVAFQKVAEPSGSILRSRSVFRCAFLRLRGSHAGPDAYHRVSDTTFVAGEHLDASAISLLRGLLAKPPSTELKLRSLPDGWFPSFALAETGAIQLFSLVDPEKFGLGVFNADPLGLAVVRGWSLYGYGSTEVAAFLARQIQAIEPIDVGQLHIDAYPHQVTPEELRPTLRRPEFNYVVSSPERLI